MEDDEFSKLSESSVSKTLEINMKFNFSEGKK